MSLEDRYFEIKNDPVKRVRLFKIIVITAYSMFILGAFLMIWVLYNGSL